MTIPIKPELNLETNIHTISNYMDKLEKYSIEQQPWPAFFTKASASFSIAHTGELLLLKFNVTEAEMRAQVRKINDEVSKDNCVELFIAFNEDDAYYNMEFNCLGSVKVAYGPNRNQRKLLPVAAIEKIKIVTTRDENQSQAEFKWSILLIIPKKVFLFTTIDTFKGISCKANFYKCGDDLNPPHYLTWKNMKTDAPDFHQSSYFGELYFSPDNTYIELAM